MRVNNNVRNSKTKAYTHDTDDVTIAVVHNKIGIFGAVVFGVWG